MCRVPLMISSFLIIVPNTTDASGASNTSEGELSQELKDFGFDSLPCCSLMILPLCSSPIHVGIKSVQEDTTLFSCQRRFFLPAKSTSLYLTENYGDAMGSHIWDASIALSAVLVRIFDDQLKSEEPMNVCEIAGGCGLVASILMNLMGSGHIIVTEKNSDSLKLLERNILQNLPESVREKLTYNVFPLEWGCKDQINRIKNSMQGPLHLVVASDVLYDWKLHDSFLSSLVSLISTGTKILLAHNHRSRSISEYLVEVVDGNYKCTANDGCKWGLFNVISLFQVSSIEIFQLVQKQEI